MNKWIRNKPTNPDFGQQKKIFLPFTWIINTSTVFPAHLLKEQKKREKEITTIIIRRIINEPFPMSLHQIPERSQWLWREEKIPSERNYTRLPNRERNVLLHSPTYKKWRFPSSGECGASLRRHFVSLSRSFFFLPPHPSDPHGEGKSAEFLLPLNAH